MAQEQQNTTATTNTFNKGMAKDMSEAFNPEGSWTHARNAVNNTVQGQTGYIGNEPANKLCVNLPYTLIGSIYLIDDQWVVFSTDNISSEIGLFDESECTYKKIINDSCLNFSTNNLITGVSRYNYDLTTSVYWDDGLNPSRVLNIDRVPYIEKPRKKTKANECYVPEYTDRLDCEAIRLASLITTPCLLLSKSPSSGTIPNGSYQVTIAYSVNNIKVTDYFTPSNIQSLFSHTNLAGGLEVSIDKADQDFDEFELVLISTVNSVSTARSVGFYSTRIKNIIIDKLDDTLPTINLNEIPLRTPAYERSDAMYEVNGYLLRKGIYTKPDFNYQPQANKIQAKWVSVEVDANYYVKGGNMVGYMRDEVYSFFIRWVYNTGEKSASYHIPGRVADGRDLANASGKDAIENKESPDTPVKRWEVNDTSQKSSITSYPLPNVNATVTLEGKMSYWESTEKYPDDKPQIWGDLCGKPIRHHKMPDSCTTHIHNNLGTKINILGVKFENITHPLDIDGTPILSIVGYEILRGSREGNRTVIAKGLLNNMAEYTIDPDITDKTGLYANYPFNDLNIDPFLSTEEVKGGCDGKGYKPMGTFRKDVFSFHSPETNFRDPYLNPYELKIHGELSGSVEAKFTPVYKHPEHKLLRDAAIFLAGAVGVGVGIMSLKGKTTTTSSGDSAKKLSTGLSGSTVTDNGLGKIGKGTTDSTSTTEGMVPFENKALMIAQGALTFTYFMGEGMEGAIKIIKAMVPYKQYAYQYNAHAFYNNFTCAIANNRRRKILDAQYINPYIQEFGSNYRVNNLFRGRIVGIEIEDELDNPKVKDDSRVTIGGLNYYNTPTKSFKRTTSAQYASLKIKMRSQYGQLDSILQVPISTCVGTTTPDAKAKFTSSVLFGGDVYVNRYTEKNPFFFFNTWLFDQPDGFPFNYMDYVNIPYPRYWMNTTDYNVSQLISPLVKTAVGTYGGGKLGLLIGQTLAKAIAPNNSTGILGTALSLTTAAAGSTAGTLLMKNLTKNEWAKQVLPNDYAHLDRSGSDCKSVNNISFNIEKAYFYLFANGVRDFFVESEINLAQRDWGEEMAQRHYDPYTYTDLQTLFRSDIIKAGNYYRYDYSLSASKLFNDKITWGYMTTRDFDPLIAKTAYSYYPRRIIYSLPQEQELKKDNWKMFLANNYKDFDQKITAMKSVNQSGVILLFETSNPMMFNGVDQLQTQNGIKVTLGDGGLFSSAMQTLTNAETVYEHGSCQSRYSVLNTPAGLYWVSQDSGKIFQYAGGLKEISRMGMKWWFSKYLPSYLLQDFPNFELYDNPVAGVGTMMTYDNTNDILYITKKDYKLKDGYKTTLQYQSSNIFKKGLTKIYLGDPQYFEDVSLTVSYDVKSDVWISFHDWHPNFVLPSHKHFMTTNGSKIWKHNDRCDLFCNFYGIDYPFEVEYISNSGQEVSTLKSVEYQLECYKYDNYCRDLNHILDQNFDRAIVYNSEQISGLLRLNLKPKNDPVAILDYPIMNTGSIDILYSKEENKYRFNQFYDVTRNRGEFLDNYQPMFLTNGNGYTREINDLYVTYTKNPLQHKKFRHYMSKVFLRKTKSEDVKMLLKLSNNKITKSFR